MIKLKNITCGYGNEPVQRKISLEILDGEVLMITGPNGVGKSTLLKVMANILYPTKGTIEYGWAGEKDPRKFIGYLPDSLSIYKSMRVNTISELHLKTYKCNARSLPLLEKASIDGNAIISDLSIGQRVILQLSLILSTNPKLILIDEILHAVDPHLRNLALDFLVRRIADDNPTVVMVNLNYIEVEHLVDRVIFLSKNGITLNETADTLVRSKGMRLPEILSGQMETAYEKMEGARRDVKI